MLMTKSQSVETFLHVIYKFTVSYFKNNTYNFVPYCIEYCVEIKIICKKFLL